MRAAGISAEIEVIRSKRKSLSAGVEHDGHVVVRAPQEMPDSHIRQFLRDYAERIEKLVQKQQERLQAAQQFPPFTNEEIRAMGEEACRIIPPRVKHFADLLGVTYGMITIRNQKTRWGSCTATGNLNFNCLLVKAPPEVLDSVIVHELCHRRHPNHSRDFYEDVYRIFPDYDRCAKWLKNEGMILMERMLGGR